MERIDIIEKLMHFNLSRQEALVYSCLWEYGQLTGYEASKLTGISRSNVYGILNVLVEKGAAVITEANTILYSAVEPEEFFYNKLRHLEEEKKYLLDNMPKAKKETEGYITICGSNHIKDKIHNMIINCEMRLYLAADEKIIQEFENELRMAKNKGLKIVLMCNRNYAELATQFYYDNLETGQVRLITDSAYVLTGELQGKRSDTCLYSGQKNLVTIMKEALKNKIRLLEMESI